MKKMKVFALFSILCLLLIIPTAFAAENETALVSSSGDSELLTADYYFDANVEDDSGNGSITNPYKKLTSARIVDNSNIHLANGEYTLNGYKRINNVTFIGENASSTIIRYYGTGFEVSSSLTLKNVTLNNLIILNKGTLNATNVIFKGGSSTNGGAIRSEGKYSINIDNCTFQDCHAKYGGAIYIKEATLNINNTIFNNTYSELFGGAITAYSKSKANINNTRFFNTFSKDDSGGAIYVYDATLNCLNVEVVNSTANFGGAITSLNSFVYMTNLTARLNNALYDGGAIYANYREFSIKNSLLDGNSAENGGAIYAFGIESFKINSNLFINNNALNTAGAIYSLSNDVYYDSILDDALNNTFINNTASFENDVYETQSPGFIIQSNDYQMIGAAEYYNGTLPSSYDLRSLGYVTSVKNQGSDGNCWAFSSLGALESSYLKATGIELDLSEENMKDIMGKFSPYGWTYETNEGGKILMAWSYLVNWLGPVNESDDKYKVDVVLSPILNALFHVHNIVILKRNNSTDNDAIKRALMSYGALSCDLCYKASYFKGNDYYYDGTEGSNHAVVLVGWDDDRQIQGAPGKGAWIAKNSWGENWKDKGYFYISYYDTKFARDDVFGFVFGDTIRYDKNYQYDIQGLTDYYLNESSVVWYKNRFTASDDEYLAAVSTYFKNECSWDLSIYVNDKLRLLQSGVVSTESYRTIELDQLISLKKGDVFEVVFKITADAEARFPISEAITFANNYFEENMSFVSYDGKNWEDLFYKSGSYSSHSYYGNQVACIKAFTILNKLKPTVELNVVSQYNPNAEFEAIVKDQYGNLVKYGKVTFTVEGESIQVDVKDGIARLTHYFMTLGNNTIKAKFSATGYDTASKSITTTIYGERSDVTLDFKSDVVDSNKYVTAVLSDLNGIAIANADIMLDINGKSYHNTTDDGGQARFHCINLVPGTYFATVYYDGSTQYLPSSASADLTVKTATSISAVYDVDAKELVATLNNDVTGQPVLGATVQFKINKASYNVKTDNSGQAKISTRDLPLGTYAATVSYGGNSKYYSSSANIDVAIKANTSLDVVYSNANKELIATLINDEAGKPIFGGTVVVKINGAKYALKTNSTGQVKVSIADLASGVYSADVSYGGNAKYYSTRTTLDVVIDVDTIISAVYKDGILKVTLVDEVTGRGIEGADILVSFGEVNYTVKTNSNGEANVSTRDLSPGTYTATVSYMGEIPSSTSIEIQVKTDVYFIVEGISVEYNTNVELVASLINYANNQPVKGANLGFKINGKSYSAKTDLNGQARVNVSGLNPNSYEVIVSYNGNTKYNPASASFDVVVNKITTFIEVYYDSNTNEVVATLINGATGKGVVGGTIGIFLNNVKNIIVTDSNGQVRLSLGSADPKSFTAYVTYAGNTKYLASTRTVTLAEDRIESYISTVYDSQNHEIVTTLTNTHTGKGVVGGTVAVVINNAQNVLKTDSNGQVRISTAQFASAIYAINSSYSGNSKYTSTSTKMSVFIRN